jgi:hypothetical protein
MDYNKALSGLVDSLSQQILESVQQRIDTDVAIAIANAVSPDRIDKLVSDAANRAAKIAAAEYKPDLTQIDAALTQSATSIIQNVSSTAERIVNEAARNHVNSLDINLITQSAVSKLLDEKLKDFKFPEKSIKSSAIDFDENISGDNVNGGIIHNFASDGIDDKATSIQLTVLDSHTVIENELLTRKLTITESTKFEGEIHLNGKVVLTSPGFVTVVDAATEKVKSELNEGLFNSYSSLIFDKIKTDGLDLSRITFNGEEIVRNNHLSSGIITSNLKRVGVLDDLQVKGEMLVANTLFVGNQRIGINTLEPGYALTLWDDDTEIILGKKQSGIGQIGTTRNQTVALTSNLKNNILLNPDGSVTMSQINLGNMSFTSSATPPNYNAPKGSVVFNANPSLGGPLGWVSLGEARWANFGIIE